MANYRKLHTPELYKQWYNLTTLYPTRVDPMWVNLDRVEYGSEISEAIKSAQFHDPIKGAAGYGRFLWDMNWQSAGLLNQFKGAAILRPDYYGKAEYLKAYLVPKTQSALMANGAPVDETLAREFIPRRHKTSNLTSQLEDAQTLIAYRFDKESVQILYLPEKWAKKTSLPEIPDRFGKTDVTFSPFSVSRNLEFRDNIYATLSHVDIYNNWYVRARLPAFDEHTVFTVEEFRYENGIDEVKVVAEDVFEKLLSKGCTVAEILQLSEELPENVSNQTMNRAINKLNKSVGGSGGEW